MPRTSAMKTFLLDLICVAVLCVILSLGLWPFHSPDNEVTWLNNHNGLRLGRHATISSSGVLQTTTAKIEESASVEIWLQPRRIWDKGTLLTFYKPGNQSQISLRQSQTGLELNSVDPNPYSPDEVRHFIENVFRKPGPVFLTVTSGEHGTSIYLEGVLFHTAPQFRFSAKELTGRLIVGDSPGQPDNWSGELRGVAIYHRE